MKVLVTGSAGFIGYHLCRKLITQNISLVGIDNLNHYYDVNLKKSRNESLYSLSSSTQSQYIFEEGDISNNNFIKEIFSKYKPKYVVNLAAQAGVRYSLVNPSAYINSNLVGFNNILESCRHNQVNHLIFASSSSVYGGNKKMPFKETDGVNHPVSLYAATKRSNELIAHTYSHIFNIPCTGLRFFTVYGPWGRPDMALFLFTKSILANEPINIYNHGKMMRDFTYIDDISESISSLIFKIPTKNEKFDFINPDPSISWAPFRIFNIGNSKPSSLMEYIQEIELNLGIKSIKNYLPLQPGDVISTQSDSSALESWIGFKPNTSIKEGVKNFINWYKSFYK